MSSPSAPSRLRAGLTQTEAGCLQWARGQSADGYGVINVGGAVKRTHRYAWELAHGPVPGDMVINHRCGNALCANTDHLELSTRKENVQYRTKLNKNNTSGFRGVYQRKSDGRWVAEVKVDRKRRTRSFATAAEANDWATETRREAYPLGEFADYEKEMA